jgi:PAS domain S-box-containing protein
MTPMLAHRRLTTILALVAIGVLLNIAVGQVVRNVLRLPVYLDSIGTILAGAVGGPLVGAATGALANVAWGVLFNDPGIIPYALTAAVIGVAAGTAAAVGGFATPARAALAGLIIGVIAAIVSAPLTAYLLEGSSGGGGEGVIRVLEATGASLLQATTLQAFLSDPIDKAISFVIVWAILRAAPGWAPSQPRARDRGSARSTWRYPVAAVLSIAAMAVAVTFLPAVGRSIFAVFYIAVAVSAWYGGLGPAVLATGLGSVAILLLPAFAPGSQGFVPEDGLNLALFLTVATLIVLITHSLEESLAEQRRSEAETRAVVDGVVEGLMLVSPDQQVVSVNRRFEELFGVPGGDLRGRRLGDLQPLVERAFVEPAHLIDRVATSASDSAARFTEVFAQTWPQERQLELFSAPVRSDGRFLGRLYGFRDVTQERELDRMKTEFVSQVSHELRTPLTAIKGFTDLILDGDAGEVNEEQSDYLQTVQQNADRLVALINDLLDVSRIESGRITLKLEPLDMHRILSGVLATMRPLVTAKAQTMTLDVPEDLPPAMGDHDRVVQVATNLVSNAHKYTPAGGAITVSASVVDGMVATAVRDTGIGIEPDDVARLFTRFFRVDSSLTREIGGTGLGLSIVKSIVELHGGTVTVSSEPGAGSTFTFTLPVATAPEPAVAADHARTPAPATSPPLAGAKHHRILLIEDDPVAAAALADHLVGSGFEVDQAGQAEAAASEGPQPDLVVVAVRATTQSQPELLASLAASDRLKGVPMLMVPIRGDGGALATPATPAVATPADADAMAPALEHALMALSTSATTRILVVEDDASVRELLCIALRKHGFDVLEAPDGETGLALASRERPGLILLDLRLPGIDGFAVLESLKRTPETTNIPVVVVTGSESLWSGSRARALSLGAADLVRKPFEVDALIAEIRALTRVEESNDGDPGTGSR